MGHKTLPAGQENDPETPPGDGSRSRYASRTDMGSFIDDFFTSFDLLPLSVFEDAGTTLPRVSIIRDRDAVTVVAELPGMQAADLEVVLGEATLRIQGHGKSHGQEETAASAPEQPHAPFFRKLIPIPFLVDVRNVRATFRGRVLRITLPRRSGDWPARIRIPIKA